MQFYTVHQASTQLDTLIASAVRDHEEAAIVSDSGSVVLIPQEEFDAMQETLRLLQDQQSLKALLAGHAQRETGGQPDFATIDQVFDDIPDSHS